MEKKQPLIAKKSMKYGLLNNMSTETLRNLIQQDCWGSEDDRLDETTIEMILEILSKREPKECDVDVNALWNTFVTEYVPTVQTPQPAKPKPPLTKKTLCAFRYFLVATLLCLLLGNCVAFASGMNLFEYIAQWTEDTFQFKKVEGQSFQNADYFVAAELHISGNQNYIITRRIEP